MKPKKPKRASPAAARPRRGASPADEATFTVVLEDLRAQFAVFGEALQDKASRGELHAVRDELRSEMHGMRDDLRSEMHGMRDDLRSEMHGMRDDLRTEMRAMRDEVRTALLDISRRLPR